MLRAFVVVIGGRRRLQMKRRRKRKRRSIEWRGERRGEGVKVGIGEGGRE